MSSSIESESLLTICFDCLKAYESQAILDAVNARPQKMVLVPRGTPCSYCSGKKVPYV